MLETEAAQTTAERLMLERVARAEQLLREQRRRVRRLQASGLELAEAQAVLKLMESITAQFHVAWELFRTFGQLPPPPATRSAMATTIESSSPAASWTARPPVNEVSCPHCGLVLHLGGDSTIAYNMNEWAQRCRHRTLQTPALCQLLRPRPAILH